MSLLRSVCESQLEVWLRLSDAIRNRKREELREVESAISRQLSLDAVSSFDSVAIGAYHPE